VTTGKAGKGRRKRVRSRPVSSRARKPAPKAAELQKQLGEALQQQTATADILRVIASSPTDVQSVLDALVESAAHLCDAERAFIFQRSGNFFMQAANYSFSRDFEEFVQQNPIGIGRGTITGRVAIEGKTVHVADVLGDPEYTGAQYQSRGHYRTGLGVPLLRAGAVIGVFFLSRSKVKPFTPKQVELVTTFADQALIAIENARLFNETQEALERQTATADVLDVISRSPTDAGPVFNIIGERAEKLCNAEISVVSVLDGDFIRVAGIRGITKDNVELFRANFPMPLDRKTVTARTIKTGAVVHISDVLADTTYDNRILAEQTGYRSCLGVPMHREGQVVGAIFVARTEPGRFSDNQIRLLEIFAGQAVIAIGNVRLFEQVQAKTLELTESLQQQTATADVLKVISRSTFDLQTVLDTLTESAARLCDADNGYLFRLQDGRHHLAASFGLDARFKEFMIKNPFAVDRGTLSGRVALERRVVIIEDAASDPGYTWTEAQQKGNLRSGLGVPLISKDTVIGIVVLYPPRVERFTESQIALVTTFADQAVIAIENARLFEEVQAKTADLSEALQQQTATADVLKAISRSAFDLQTVLDALLTSACRLCEADIGTIRYEDGDSYRLAATYGCKPEWIKHFSGYSTRPDQSSVFGQTIIGGRTVHMPDVLANPDYKRPQAQKLMGFRAALGVPLLRDGHAFGVINLFRFAVGSFEPKQIEIVETFADQAVIAIENVRLFDEVRARTEDLAESLQQQTATADVLKAISRSAFDLQTVLKALVEAAARLCEADQGTIARQQGSAFVRVATWGFSDEFTELVRNLPVELHRGSATGRALLERQTVHIADVQADPEYTFADAMKLGGFRTIIAVPMLREGVPIGVLALTRIAARPFTQKQIELVTTFTDQAAIAIENVRLFEQVQQRTRELAKSLDELRTAQDRLVQTEKLASLGQLTAGIAHEIKNPLNFVNNFSALSAELVGELNDALSDVHLDKIKRKELDEIAQMLKDNLEKVVQHGKRADSIVKNMLQHSREGSGEHRPADINAIVDESLNLAYHGARAEKAGFGIALQRDLDPAAGTADVYPQEITRVLLNLISNGFYAATKRKAEAGDGFEPMLSAATKNLGDQVEIRIRDNGTGIPEEVREKIFNPFFTTKPAGEGTGLGLSMSHDIIVKQHGGSIDVETAPGHFTEFRIVLPRGMSRS